MQISFHIAIPRRGIHDTSEERGEPEGSQGNQGSKRPLREGRVILYWFLPAFMQKFLSLITFTRGFERPAILDAFLQA